MSLLAFDIAQLYRQTFGGRPYVIDAKNITPSDDQYSDLSSLLKTKYLNKEIWLPVKFYDLRDVGFSFSELLLPYSTVKISSQKSIIKTSLVERAGTVKELFNMDDYQIQIKGFAIDDEKRIFPEKQLDYLRGILESDKSIGLDNALTNIFLRNLGQKVAVISGDFPEVTGGRKHVRPFSLTLESDSVFELIVD